MKSHSFVIGRFSAVISSPPFAVSSITLGLRISIWSIADSCYIELSQKATIYKNVEVVVNKDAFVNENDVDIDDFSKCS